MKLTVHSSLFCDSVSKLQYHSQGKNQVHRPSKTQSLRRKGGPYHFC